MTNFSICHFTIPLKDARRHYIKSALSQGTSMSASLNRSENVRKQLTDAKKLFEDMETCIQRNSDSALNIYSIFGYSNNICSAKYSGIVLRHYTPTMSNNKIEVNILMQFCSKCCLFPETLAWTCC